MPQGFSFSPHPDLDLLESLFLFLTHNSCRSIVEAVADKHNVIKMEFALTDTFLITSGIPEASENHPEQMADFALDLMEAIKDVSVNGKHIEMKIGIHSGETRIGGARGG